MSLRGHDLDLPDPRKERRQPAGPLRVLMLEDVPTDAELVIRELRRGGLELVSRRVESREAFREALREFVPDIVLADFHLPAFDGLSALAMAREIRPETPFIFVSGSIGEELAIAAMRDGATDYVFKDRLKRLPVAVRRALDEVRERAERRELERAHEHAIGEVVRRTALGRLISDISAHFVSLPSGRLDSGIDRALERIGRVLDVDRTYLFLFSEEGTRVSNTHEWAAPGISAQKENLQNLPADACRWWMSRMRAHLPVVLETLADLPPEAAAECDLLKAQEIDSLVAVPVLHFNQLTGFLGCDSVHRPRSWRSDEIALIKLVADKIGHALSRREQEQKAEEMQRLLEQRAHLANLGELAAQITHEFNNVLMAVRPVAELLKRAPDDRQTVARAGAQLTKSVERGRRLTAEILRFGRPRLPQLEPVEFHQWIGTVYDEMRPVVPEGIEIRVAAPQQRVVFRIDPHQLHQVLTNLILNAAEAIGEKGTITILVDRDAEVPPRKRGKFAHLCVLDSGPGIPPDVLPKVFEPLFTTKRTGTGLGLAISRQIVADHGGTMTVESRPGRTKFTLELPLDVAGS